MKNSAIGILSFAAGAAIGSAVTWIFVKKKYEKIAQEEIDSVKETFSKLKEETTSTEEVTQEFEEEDYEEYETITQNYGHEVVPSLGHDKPYTISPAEFGEDDEYERFNFTYYADGTLTDENDCIIEDVEGTIGLDVSAHFGEFEDDSVHVRNDKEKCEYEILFDQRSYDEVLKQKPYLMED